MLSFGFLTHRSIAERQQLIADTAVVLIGTRLTGPTVLSRS